MFCSRCGKTLKGEDKNCPYCGSPVGDVLFEGTPYTSVQARIAPRSSAGQASAAYTRTSYTSMSDESQRSAAVDSRTSYRPVYDEASVPEDVRGDVRAAIHGEPEEEPEAQAPERPAPETLSEDALNTLNAVEEELTMDSVDTSELRSRPIESTGRAGISSEVEDYIQKLEATQSRRAARRRRATAEVAEDVEDVEAPAPQEEAPAYDDIQPEPEEDERQSEAFDDMDEEEFDDMGEGRVLGVKDILRIAGIMVLAAVLIVGGVLWFRHIRGNQNASKIEGVTQTLYDSGLQAIKERTQSGYVTELTNVYGSEGVLGFTQRTAEDSAQLDALLPAEPAVNDPLFISVLQTIQTNIGNAILMDASEAEQGSLNPEQDSAARWAIVNDAITQVENATTAQELTAVLNGEKVTVASSPTPSPTPAAVTYNQLSKGDKSDEVLEMQNRLFMLGFLLDDRDGAFGSKTQTAVKLFQKYAGLEATGIADSQTLALLYSDDAPRTEYAQVTPTPPPTTETETTETEGTEEEPVI